MVASWNFLLSGLDAVSMSLAIYWTGAANSPLSFLYFIPLIVHAFHRDSTVVMFSVSAAWGYTRL